MGHFEESGLLPVPHVERCYLWSSLTFTFTYNDGHIISANVSTANTLPISLDAHVEGDLKVEFSYSGMFCWLDFKAHIFYLVRWLQTDIKFKDRDHLKGKFFPKTLEIHWLSVINSVVLGNS